MDRETFFGRGKTLDETGKSCYNVFVNAGAGGRENPRK